MLNDFVVGVLGASAGDGGRTGALPDGDCVLAYVLEPDVVDVARALAVDALGLIGSDDDVPEKSARVSGCC